MFICMMVLIVVQKNILPINLMILIHSENLKRVQRYLLTLNFNVMKTLSYKELNINQKINYKQNIFPYNKEKMKTFAKIGRCNMYYTTQIF